MSETIMLQGRNVEYTKRTSSRSRHLRLSVKVDGSVVVSHPRFTGGEKIEKFIEEKADWILEKLRYFDSFDRTLLKTKKGGKLNFANKKDDALLFVTERVMYWNKFYKFEFKNIKVKNQKTRWGSCSKSGTLSFNYNLLDLPKVLSDYVVVHELCHLKEFNHSKKFWNLVAKTFPDFRQHREKLKKYIV